jgi:MATE family multidrug resistance protein
MQHAASKKKNHREASRRGFSEFLSNSKVNLALAIPVIVGQLGHIATGVADSIMVGQLGTVPLAAVSFANSFLALPLVLGIGISYGLTPLVARAMGQGKHAKTGRLLKNSLWINGVLGAALALLTLAVPAAGAWLGQPQDVMDTATGYVNVVGFSLFPLMLFMSYKQFTEGRGNTVMATRISLIGNGLNIGLNYLLIYGLWGFPELGMTGAGVATAISRIFMAAALAWSIHRAPSFQESLAGFHEAPPRKKPMAAILKLGVPTALQYLFEVGAFAASAWIIGTTGAIPLAAHQIAINLASISYMAASGFGAAATIRVGQFLGQNKPREAQSAATNLFILTLGFMALAGVAFFLGKEWLPSLYNEHPGTIAAASQLLLVAVFFQLSDGVQVTALGALRGLGDVRIPTWATFVVYFGITLPLAYFAAKHWGMGALGVWQALALGLTLSAGFLTYRFYRVLKTK